MNSANRPLETEQVACPVCGSGQSDSAFVRSDGGKVVRCRSCRMLYLNPRPTLAELMKMYDRDYFEAGTETSSYTDYMSLEMRALHEGTNAGYAALRLLEQETDVAGKSVLEVGCGSGCLLEILRRSGASVRGLDVAEYAVQHCRKQFQIDVTVGTLESAAFPAGSFDIVIGLQFIEHVSRPVEILTEMRRILRPGGVCMLATPNAKAAEKWGEGWLGFHISFEHLLYFEPESLRGAFKAAGFGRTRMWTQRAAGAQESVGLPAPPPAAWKRLLKSLAGNLPPVRFRLNNWRVWRQFRPADERPFEHHLWVTARRD
jgi:2-polyprenyl-3-methyl-5-hydroxy-6-metoxy-1,4-benzoquinol methylase